MSILLDNNIDIAFISETWLSSETNSVTAHIKSYGFDLIHVFRDKRGGGVAILWNKRVQKHIKFSPVKHEFKSFQYHKIVFNGTIKTDMICIYRFQETEYAEFCEELNVLLSQHDPCNPLILTGDFNYHFEKSESSHVCQLTDLVSSFGLTQFVSGPTHRLGHTLDLLFANPNYFNIDTIHPVDFNIGDHFPVFFELPICSSAAPALKKRIVYRDFKSVDMPSFANNISTALHTAFDSNSDSSTFHELLGVYNNVITDEINSVAPEKTKMVSNFSSPPWMDGEYKSARATRRRLERIWKETGLPSDKKAYYTQSDFCANLSNSKRTTYHSRIIQSKKGDVRALFSVANKLFDNKKSSAILPQHDDSKVMANQFNNFYNDKVELIRNKIPLTQFDRQKYCFPFNGTPLNSFRPTTIPELSEILKTSGIKTSFHDILPANVLKQVIDVLLPYFCDLVNKSLTTGSVDGMKESIINPLLKKAGIDPEVLKNYRPVSDLLFLSKLTERVVDRRLHEHMSINNLHCAYEHGYKKCHSTETLLLPLVNNTLLSLDAFLAVIWLLIDLSAAFDTVDIDLELHILEFEIGIGGTALKWFSSFLKGRLQRVLVEKSLSDTLEVKYGVPQGSVLGPILFNIYIKSLFELIKDNGFCTSGYADDNNASQSFALHFQVDVITNQVPHLMSLIKEWMNAHFLKLNPDKTEIICFLPPNVNESHVIKGTFLGGDCVRFSSSVKNLGFTIDRPLKMDLHANGIVSHTYKLLGDVGRNRHLLSNDDTETIVHSIVSSRLDYCNSLFYGVEKSVINKLQKLQNAAARTISKRKKRESVRDVLVSLHWLPVETRIVFKLLVITYKIIHGLAPESLSNLLSYRCENTLTFNIIFLNSSFGRQSFSYAAPRFWNALPTDIKFSVSLDSFKSKTKHYLFNNFSALKSRAFMYNV